MRKRRRRRTTRTTISKAIVCCFCVHIQVTFFSLFFFFLFVLYIRFEWCTPYYNVFLVEIKTNIYKQNKSKKKALKEHLLCFFFCLSSTMSCINYITSFFFFFSLSLSFSLYLAYLLSFFASLSISYLR